eukprot:UN11775
MMTVVISNSADENSWNMESEIINVVNKALYARKRQQADFFYSFSEQTLENAIIINVPIIAECLDKLISKSDTLSFLNRTLLDNNNRHKYDWCPNNKLQWILNDKLMEKLNVSDKVQELYDTNTNNPEYDNGAMLVDSENKEELVEEERMDIDINANEMQLSEEKENENFDLIM